MSGWTIITVRGKPSKEYKFSRDDNHDPWDATSDLAATFDAESRVRHWTVWSGHVYAYLASKRYDWDFAEELLEDYSAAIRDAVVLGANDTTDIGTARYYPSPTGGFKSEYRETQHEDGTHVGEIALAVMTAQHGIVARDPWHNDAGKLDGSYLDSGSKLDGDAQ